MKIAMTHVDLPNETKGGVAAQAHYLANALSYRGHEVTMYTFSPAFAGCLYKIHKLDRPARLRKLSSFLFASQLSAIDFSAYDILHTHGDNYLLQGRHPQVRTFHGSAKDEAASAITVRRRAHQEIMASLERRGAAVADLCVGVSETTRTRIPLISEIVPCGVDTSSFHPGEKSPCPAILFVGTVDGRKRGRLLAEIFQQEVRPKIVNAQLWSVAEKDMQGEGIVNMGRVDLNTLTDLFRRAWLFCLPSAYEGFGVPYIEAMASGTAVVATSNPGACEVLRNGSDGLIVSDVELGSAITALLQNAEQRQQMETVGLSRAAEFSWHIVAAKYEEIYMRLVNSRPQLSRTL